ncbi:MAG: acyl carrier protein [Ignavibacteriaceae bacterium]
MNYISIIKEFIVENFLFGDAGSLTGDTDLFDKSILDSTGVIELVSFIEIEFNIVIDDFELVAENFSSINRIASFLESKILKHA